MQMNGKTDVPEVPGVEKSGYAELKDMKKVAKVSW
jgi:hypothetical protein